MDLVVTPPLAGSIVEVMIHDSPLQALKSLRVTVENATEPPLLICNSLLGGSAPHLREIKLDGIAFPFPAVRQVLSSTNNLVELHLSSIPNDVYFSPDDLITTLSTLVHLKSLTIGFHSPASRPPPSPPTQSITNTRPPIKRTITLSSLTHLEFHGASEYLEEFIAQIDDSDSPFLDKITVKLFNRIQYEIPQFCRFIIPRLKALAAAHSGYLSPPPTWTLVTHSAESISVMFLQEAGPPDRKYCLGTSCQRLDRQLSFVTQITSQLSPFILSSVQSLLIKNEAPHRRNSEMEMMPSGEDVDSDPAQWLELFRPFRHVKHVHVWEKRFVPGIAQALALALATEQGGVLSVLPDLNWLNLSGYRESPSVANAVEEFAAARRLAGRTVGLIG
jgi:hypothetical protein